MNENGDQQQESKEPAAPKKSRERLQSSIQFPYGDLDTAVEVASAIHNNGYKECAPDQLAAAMGQQPSSGNFRQKVSAARIFGLIDTSPGRILLTDLGYRALDPAQKKKAYADAFLSVELYRALYDDFRGKQLPPRPAALERAFESYGVSPKQTDKARQVFDRSAKQAGFYRHGNDKLVIPGGIGIPLEEAAPHSLKQETTPPSPQNGGTVRGGHIPPHIDPLIAALLHKIPESKVWSLSERARWLRALSMNLSFVYDSDDNDKGEIQVSIQADPLARRAGTE